MKMSIAKQLTFDMDKFATGLLAGVKGDATPLPDKVIVFKEVARWIGIKNRLELGDGEGDKIHEYRDRLKGQTDKRARDQANRSAGGRAGMAVRHGTKYPAGNGGSALDAIKSRVPAANDGGAGGNGDDAGGPLPAFVGGGRGFSVGLSKPADADDDDAGDNDRL